MAKTDINDLYDSTVSPGPKSASGAIQTHEKRSIYVVSDGEDPTQLEPGHVEYLAFGGVIFRYDATDATSVHDGVTVIVTSDSKRFKSDATGAVFGRYLTVLDKDLANPPVSPSNGDQYIVATGGTGDWATKDGLVAIYGARGWRFMTLATNDLVFVSDETQIYHKASGGSLTLGLPGYVIGTGAVDIANLKRGLGLAVENQSTNDPPASPSLDDAYIVGPVPTGAWAGEAGKIAIWNGTTWTIIAPQTGWSVYDKGAQTFYGFDGSVWVGNTSGVLAIKTVQALGSATPTLAGSGVYGFSQSTGPTTALRHIPDSTVEVAYTGKSTSNKLRVRYRANLSMADIYSGGGTLTGAVFVDSETDARAWFAIPYTSFSATVLGSVDVEAIVDVPDGLEHIYKVKLFSSVNFQASPAPSLANRTMTVEELVAS